MPAQPSRPRRIFLSYAREDASAADTLRQELTKRGASVWTPEELNVAAPIPAAVAEVLKSSDVVLVLLSEAALRSSWVLTEFGMAIGLAGDDERTKVVALLLEEASLPADLASTFTLDATSGDWSAIADRLLRTHPQVGEIPGADLDRKISDLLDELGWEWQREPVIAGLRPDFLVETPNRRRAVIEAKARDDPSLVEAITARTQAARLAEATGVDAAYVVFRHLTESLFGESIVSVPGLREALLRLAAERRPTEREDEGEPEPEADEGRTVFAAMPFDPEYSDVYWVAMREAAKAVDVGCVRVDEDDFTGDIVARIKELINDSVAVIADLSEGKANVLYEVGYAHALDIPAIHISSTPLDELPFDVRNWNTMRYRKGETHRLKDDLESRLRKILKDRQH